MEAKKLTILRIYEILADYSDEDHPLTQKQIIDLLRSKYGIECERKAVARNISYLREAGKDITDNGKGVYLNDRLFEKSELLILINSVMSSRYIDKKHSDDLIKKLLSLGGNYFKDSSSRVFSTNESLKTENKVVFYNIEIIDEAISDKKQIEFVYNCYDANKKLVPRRDSKYVVNPYYLILHNQRYYLMCNMVGHEDLCYLRLDRMTDVSVLSTFASAYKNLSDKSMKKLVQGIDKQLPYMFGGKVEDIRLRCSKAILNDLVDWFGNDFYVERSSDQYVDVRLKSSVQAMHYWVLQFADNVEVLAPNMLRDLVKQSIIKLNDVYKIT